MACQVNPATLSTTKELRYGFPVRHPVHGRNCGEHRMCMCGCVGTSTYVAYARIYKHAHVSVCICTRMAVYDAPACVCDCTADPRHDTGANICTGGWHQFPWAAVGSPRKRPPRIYRANDRRSRRSLPINL